MLMLLRRWLLYLDSIYTSVDVAILLETYHLNCFQNIDGWNRTKALASLVGQPAHLQIRLQQKEWDVDQVNIHHIIASLYYL